MPRSRVSREKILVYLFGSLGDSIVAIPALRAVRRRFPDAEIVMLQNFEANSLVVASEVIPEALIDRYLNYTSKRQGVAKAAAFGKLWLMLRRERFDAAVYLVMSERPKKAVRRDRAFFKSAGIALLYGFHALREEDLCPVEADGHPAFVKHEAELKLKRLAIDGIETLADPDFAVPLLDLDGSQPESSVRLWLKENRVRPGLPLITFAPGCKSQANSWPIDNFIELGRRLIDTLPCEVVVVGGPAEKEAGERLISTWRTGINAAGRFTVKESGELLSQALVHIGLDTGTMHLAAAAGTRCFVIFGERSNPGMWYPLGPGHTIVYHRVACAGCHLQVCNVDGHPCMNNMSVDGVWEHLAPFLAQLDEPMRSRVQALAI